MAVLDHLRKLKRGLGLALGAHFLHDFSIKMFIILYSVCGESFNVIPFSFSMYQTKCVKFLFKQLMTSQTLRFIFDYPLKQWRTGRKRGEVRNIKM